MIGVLPKKSSMMSLLQWIFFRNNTNYFIEYYLMNNHFHVRKLQSVVFKKRKLLDVNVIKIKLKLFFIKLCLI